MTQRAASYSTLYYYTQRVLTLHTQQRLAEMHYDSGERRRRYTQILHGSDDEGHFNYKKISDRSKTYINYTMSSNEGAYKLVVLGSGKL